MLPFAAIFALFAFANLHPQLASGNGVQAGQLVEATEYSACDYHCAPFNRPTTAYCIQVGSERWLESGQESLVSQILIACAALLDKR
jgi:hypothetical protein